MTPAPPRGPLTGTAIVPGDKSISHRALILAALAVGRSRIERSELEGSDVASTIAALRAMGARIADDGDGGWSVDGVGVGGLLQPEAPFDMRQFGDVGAAADGAGGEPPDPRHLHRRRLALSAGRWTG